MYVLQVVHEVQHTLKAPDQASPDSVLAPYTYGFMPPQVAPMQQAEPQAAAFWPEVQPLIDLGMHIDSQSHNQEIFRRKDTQ